MEISLITAITILTGLAMILGTFVGIFKSWKSGKKEWETPMSGIQKELESYKHNNQLRFAEFESKIQLLSIDAEKIADVKAWVSKVEKTINEETTKLEGKFDELMRIIIDLMGKK